MEHASTLPRPGAVFETMNQWHSPGTGTSAGPAVASGASWATRGNAISSTTALHCADVGTSSGSLAVVDGDRL